MSQGKNRTKADTGLFMRQKRLKSVIERSFLDFNPLWVTSLNLESLNGTAVDNTLLERAKYGEL